VNHQTGTRFARSVFTRARQTSLSSFLPYTIGRFHLARRCYSRTVGIKQFLVGRGRLSTVKESVFPPMDVRLEVKSLRKTAVSLGWQLPPELVKAIGFIAHEKPCRPHGDGPEFLLRDVVNGRLPNGQPAIIASVVGAESTEPVQTVAEDPQVLSVVSSYLNYVPKNRHVRLVWSFVNNCGVDERRLASQTVDYHFDVYSFNFVYANYYLSPVDANSGAHVMVLGSHSKKPIRWLLGSARQTDELVQTYYGDENVFLIEGPPGTGFIQDSSCYHKALAPRSRQRLMLQVRYF